MLGHTQKTLFFSQNWLELVIGCDAQRGAVAVGTWLRLARARVEQLLVKVLGNFGAQLDADLAIEWTRLGGNVVLSIVQTDQFDLRILVKDVTENGEYLIKHLIVTTKRNG